MININPGRAEDRSAPDFDGALQKIIPSGPRLFAMPLSDRRIP